MVLAGVTDSAPFVSGPRSCATVLPFRGLAAATFHAARVSREQEETMNTIKAIRAGYWIATSLFALQMGFSAYAQLSLPQVAEAFTHLGFPAYFRVELSWLKLAGVLVLLVPAPDRVKEWAYAGFAITLGSAVVAHLAVGDDASHWSWAVGAAVLWAVSYFMFRKLAAEKAHPLPELRHAT